MADAPMKLWAATFADKYDGVKDVQVRHTYDAAREVAAKWAYDCDLAEVDEEPDTWEQESKGQVFVHVREVTVPSPSTKWYVVIGRAHGYDECSPAVYEAVDALDAEQRFDREMRELNDWPLEPNDEDDAEGRIVYIDRTFECDTKPRVT